MAIDTSAAFSALFGGDKKAFIKMCHGNQGAFFVLSQLLENKYVGCAAYMRNLYDANIFGEKIWKLYKDCCGRNFNKFI